MEWREALEKSTHTEIRDVVRTFSLSRSTERYTVHDCGHVLHARTDKNVFFSLPCICCMAQAIQIERSGLSDSFSIVAIGHRAVVLRALRSTHGSACPATARAQRVLLEAMFTLNGCEAVLVRVPGGAEAPG